MRVFTLTVILLIMLISSTSAGLRMRRNVNDKTVHNLDRGRVSSKSEAFSPTTTSPPPLMHMKYKFCNSVLFTSFRCTVVQLLHSNPNILIRIQEIFSKKPNSVACMHDILVWIRDIKKHVTDPKDAHLWSLQMLDAWGEPPSGMLRGHVNAYGDFQQCIGIRSHEEVNNTTEVPVLKFEGKYFWVHLLPHSEYPELQRKRLEDYTIFNKLKLKGQSVSNKVLPRTPSTTVCMPSSCTNHDVQLLLLGAATSIPGSQISTPVVVFSVTDDKEPYSQGAKVMLFFIIILLLLIHFGTFCDATTGPSLDRQSKFWKLVLSFSLIANVKSWTNTSAENRSDISCIHGIRFLSIVWVIFRHLTNRFRQYPIWNSFELTESKLLHLLNFNGTHAVDSFFTIGGMMVYMTCRKYWESQRSSLLKFYLHRIIRFVPNCVFHCFDFADSLVPVYFFVVGFNTTISSHFGDGPFLRPYMNAASKACGTGFYNNFLFMSNLLTYKKWGVKMCESYTWYVMVDFQLFVVSTLVIFLLLRNNRIGFINLSAVSAVSVIAVLHPHIFNLRRHFQAYLSPAMIKLLLKDPHMNPLMREGPYLVGIWLGILLNWIKSCNIRVQLHIFLVLTGWCICIFGFLGILSYSPRFGLALPIYRTLWGFLISWLIFACTTGHGGLINSFLSWKAFVPLGKLTYCVYISSYRIQRLTFYTRIEAILFSWTNVTSIFMSDVIICFLVGFCLYITVELPFTNLGKLLLQGDRHQETSFTPKKCKSLKDN